MSNYAHQHMLRSILDCNHLFLLYCHSENNKHHSQLPYILPLTRDVIISAHLYHASLKERQYLKKKWRHSNVIQTQRYLYSNMLVSPWTQCRENTVPFFILLASILNSMMPPIIIPLLSLYHYLVPILYCPYSSTYLNHNHDDRWRHKQQSRKNCKIRKNNTPSKSSIYVTTLGISIPFRISSSHTTKSYF